MAEDENNPPPPPPPPEDAGGYQAEGYVPEQQPAYEEDGVADAAGPAVAASANKNFILVVIGGVLAAFLLYQIFFSSDDAPAPAPTQPQTDEIGAPVAQATDIPIPTETFQLPPPPPLPTPEVEEESLPPPPPLPTTPVIDFTGEEPANEELLKRRNSQMLIVNSDTAAEPRGNNREDVTSVAERAVATKVGDLNNLVLQGKVIDAVLETALDTTLQGPLRAIVSRDIYAESGYGVLIPKGSRLIGAYNTDVVRGQGRVFIIWSRLIRPDGIDVQLNSQAIDRLGRAGMPGHVDERYFEIFGGAVLTSILGITIAGIADAILDPDLSSTTQNSDGSTTSTGSGVDESITTAVTDIGAVSQRVVSGLLDTRPSITVDQGTPLKVFVNRDLEFPGQAASQVRIIQ